MPRHTTGSARMRQEKTRRASIAVFMMFGLSASAAASLGCGDDTNCSPLPCPYPGWDPSTCSCRRADGGPPVDAGNQ